MIDQVGKKLAYETLVLFGAVAAITIIGIPWFGIVYGFSLFDWVVCAAMYVITGMGITVGYHRLISHRSFECHRWVKLILLVAGGWALQNSALIWCSDHIRHHARTDQEEDPYNATKGFWHSHCGWLFVHTPHRTDNYAKQLRKDPVIMWQHRYYWLIVVTGLAFPFALGYWHDGILGGISCFLLGGLLRMFMVLNSSFSINSLCHMFGTQPHGDHDSSRDSWLISFISFGEGYHNYHHTYARDFRNGPKWYNFDPSKWIIYTLSLFGMASNLRRLDRSVMPE